MSQTLFERTGRINPFVLARTSTLQVRCAEVSRRRGELADGLSKRASASGERDDGHEPRGAH